MVNRTQASQATQGIDAVHKALALETSDLQKAGAKASMNGLSDELMKNNRFNDVKPLKSGSPVLWCRNFSFRLALG